MKLIKDVLYGYIEIPNEFLPLIDNKYFQRLRYIKQLGFSYLVYPNAIHSRFVHSLGVYHLTKQFIKKNKIEEKNELLIAALYHDIGHGPFSHSFEYAIDNYNHEKRGLEILKELQDEIERVADFKLVVEYFKGKKQGKIISFDIGTDRLDYLKRDSYFTGVNFATFDNERIIKNMYIQENDIIVKKKAYLDIVALLLSRFFLFRSVYLHKISHLFDEIFKDLVNLLLNYKSVNELSRMTDEELLFFAKNLSDKNIQRLVNKILFREIPKYKWVLEVDFKNKEEIIGKLKEIKDLNLWFFFIDKSFKEPKIMIEDKPLKSSPLIKSIKKEEEKMLTLYIYSDKDIGKEIKDLFKK